MYVTYYTALNVIFIWATPAIWIITLLWYLNGTRLQTNVLERAPVSFTDPLLQPVSTPLFSTRLYPDLFCSNTHRSHYMIIQCKIELLYATVPLNIKAFH